MPRTLMSRLTAVNAEGAQDPAIKNPGYVNGPEVVASIAFLNHSVTNFWDASL